MESKSTRVNSLYSWSIHQNLVGVAENIDFNHHIFLNKQKRNRSLGSAQALIVELALTDEIFLDKLRKFMVNKGRDWKPIINYTDRYESFPS